MCLALLTIVVRSYDEITHRFPWFHLIDLVYVHVAMPIVRFTFLPRQETDTRFVLYTGYTRYWFDTAGLFLGCDLMIVVVQPTANQVLQQRLHILNVLVEERTDNGSSII